MFAVQNASRNDRAPTRYGTTACTDFAIGSWFLRIAAEYGQQAGGFAAAGQEAARKVLAEVPQSDSVRDRVARHFIREFRAQRREPRLTEGLTQVMRATARIYSTMLEPIEHVHQQILRHVAGGGFKLSEQQLLVLPLVTDIFSAATQRWLAGKCSVEEARFEIEAGCELLEIPDEIVGLARKQAAPEVGPVPS